MKLRYAGGSGGTTEKVFSADVTIGGISPAVTEKVKFDDEGEMSSITNNCGETENRRENDKLPKVTLEGYVTEYEHQDMKDLYKGQTVRLVSDVHTGPMEVKKVTITQNSDVVSLVADGFEALVFDYQVQLRQKAPK
jgi:hypothetical protein